MSTYEFSANYTVFLNHKNIASAINDDPDYNAIPSHKLFKDVYNELSTADKSLETSFNQKLEDDKSELISYANSISSELSNTVTNKGYVIYNEQYFSYNTDTHELSLTFVTDKNRTHSIAFDTDALKINSVISTMQVVTVTPTDGSPEYDALQIWWKDANSENQCYHVDIRLDKLAQIYTEGEGITIDKSLDGKGRFVVSVNNYNTITSDVSNLKVDTTNISSHTLDIQSYVNKLSAQNGIISTLNNDIKTAQTTANTAQSSADEISADVITIQNYVDDLQKADGIIQTIQNDITAVNFKVDSLSSKHNDLEQHVGHIQSYVNELSINNGIIDVIENNIDDLSSKHISELANIQTNVNTISSDTTAIKSYINELSVNNGTIDVIENNIHELSTKHISELTNIQTDVNTISSDTDAIKSYVNELSTNDGIIDSLILNDSIMSNDISTLFKEIRHDLTITGHLLSLDTRFESGTKTLSAILTEYNLGETGTIKNGSIVDVTLADVSSEYTTTDGVKLCNGDIIIIHDHTDAEAVELVSLTTTGDNKNVYIIHTDVTRHEFDTLSSTVSVLSTHIIEFFQTENKTRLGVDATVSNYGIALGTNAETTNIELSSSIAIGNNSKALAANTIAIGDNISAVTTDEIIIGSDTNLNQAHFTSMTTSIGNKELAYYESMRTQFTECAPNSIMEHQPEIEHVLNKTSTYVYAGDESEGVWIAATRSSSATGGLYRSIDEGRSWTLIFGSNISFASVIGLGNGRWLAGTYSSENVNNEGIYYSNDNGLTWKLNTNKILNHKTHEELDLTVSPWSFAKGRLTINNITYDAIIAGLTQKKGAIYSLDNGITWYGGDGWTNINTAILDVHFDDRFGGFTWLDNSPKWIAGGGNNTENRGGLWYLDESTFTWKQITEGVGSSLIGSKIQAIEPYRTKTNKVYLYISETAPTANGKRYYIDVENTTLTEMPTTLLNTSKKLFNSYCYKFIEMSDGYLYTTPYQNGTIVRITDDGTQFEQFTLLDKFGQGYTVFTNTFKSVMCCGFWNNGIGRLTTVSLTERLNSFDTSITTINNSINTLDLSVKTIDTTIDTINTQINTLDSNINSKIFIKDIESGNSGYTNLSVIEIYKDEYDELVLENNLLSNVLYVISSDYIDAYGGPIKNLVMDNNTVPSEATNKNYVDTQIEALQLQINSLTATIGDINTLLEKI